MGFDFWTKRSFRKFCDSKRYENWHSTRNCLRQGRRRNEEKTCKKINFNKK